MMTYKSWWLTLKLYIPGTWAWGAKRYLKKRGLWSGQRPNDK